MEMKASDVLDRWTILEMKSRYNDSAKTELEIYNLEVADLLVSLQDSKKQFEVICLIVNLMEANSKIWENESAIRNEFPNDPSNTSIPDNPTNEQLIETGRRTLLIRSYNKLRVQAKTKIDQFFNQIPDVKVNHQSQ